jgi:hypothetical protein
MKPNPGKRPCSAQTRVRVKWHQGWISNETFRAEQLRWTLSVPPYAFDIAEWEPVG